MSSFRHPVGPERPGVYWRRRALVLGVVLLIVVVVLLIVVGRGNGAPTAGPSGAPTTDTAASRAADRPAAESSTSPTPSAVARKDGAPCAAEQITLTPVVDKSVYGATDDPKVAMTIENTGSNSCHMDLGSSQQVLTITSGTEQYWSSKDCQTGGTNQDVTLKAGQELTTPTITWDRTRSSATTCDAARPAVTAGGASYHLQVAVGEIKSAESVQFVLS
jgi:hypothetical protein